MADALADVANSQRVVNLPDPDRLRLSAAWPANVARWADPIETWAAQYAIDPDLLAAIVLVESGGNPNAVSHSGACGLAQVMTRDTTRAYGTMFASRPTCAELQDPGFNIGWATHFLVTLYERNGRDWRTALYRYGPHDRGFAYADLVLSHYRNAIGGREQ